MINNDDAVVLIVDDNLKNLKILGKTLQENSYVPVAAKNGPQALDFAQRAGPDLILLDVMMPGMDGFEVCRKLKARDDTKNIPIIFLTASTERKDLLKGFEAGGVDFVTKPYDSIELLLRVKSHIELKRAREEIRTLWGILPICCECKNIRDDDGYWHRVETYLNECSDVRFTHGYCPGCAKKAKEEMKQLIEEKMRHSTQAKDTNNEKQGG